MIRVSQTSRPFALRDAAQQRDKAQRIQVYDQVGMVLIMASTITDESSIQVTFVNTFIEKPIFTYGFELAQGAPQPGSFPTGAAVVLSWTGARGPIKSFTGATLGVVTTGLATQQLYLHYSFKGRAISYTAESMPNTGLASL